MNPVTSYFVACFIMTVLWFLAVPAAIGGFVATIMWITGSVPGRDLTDTERARSLKMAYRSWLTLVVTVPLLTTLYRFWGHW